MAPLSKDDNFDGSHEQSVIRNIVSFCTSPTTVLVTLLRLALEIPPEWLAFQSDSFFLWFLHNPDLRPIWTSLLMRPHETWSHIQEAQAVRHVMGGTWEDAYRGNYIHVPPLVLAALEPVLSIADKHLQKIVIGCFSHLIDLLIAIQFLRLGQHVLQKLQDCWEDELQPKIPASLRAPNKHIFALETYDIIYSDELPASKSQISNDEKTNSDSVRQRTRQAQSESEIEERDNNDFAKMDNSQEDEDWEPIAEVRNEHAKAVPSRFSFQDLPLLAAETYYYSPLTAMASSNGSFQQLWLLLLLCGLMESCRQPTSTPLVAFWVALASYTEIHYAVFLFPIALWIQRNASFKQKQQISLIEAIYPVVFWYLVWCACLQGLSLVLVGVSMYPSVLYSSFGVKMTWKNLHPNLSVLWYLNMELFERFRFYFSVLIGGLPYLLVVPLTVRLHRYPMVLVTIFWMLWTMIRPSSTLVDANIACCFALLCPRSLARMRIAATLIPTFAITVPISLYLVTLWLWLETGSGEANFTFFQCLAYCVFLAALCLEFSGASLRRDKVLRLTEKELALQKEKDR